MQSNITQQSLFQISEEIAENELEDADEVVEETEDTSVSALKDNDLESENDIEEQEFADAVGDDGSSETIPDFSYNWTQTFILDDDIEDDDDSEEDELEEKPTTYAGLSLLGLRNYFSRFFQ